MNIVHSGTVKQQDAGTVQRGVGDTGVFLAGLIREDADRDGRFQIGMGTESTGQIKMGNICLLTSC